MGKRIAEYEIEPALLRREKAAQYLDVGLTKFNELVQQFPLLTPIRIDGLVRWSRKKQLDPFIDQLLDQQDQSWPEPAV